MTKIDRALVLRDMALIVLRDRGALQSVSGPDWCGPMYVVTFRKGDLHMLQRTPFSRLPEAPPFAKYLAAKKGRDHAGNLPYGLDVWRNGKVLNIEWADDGRVDLISYKPGDWEDDVIALATAIKAQMS